MQAKAPRLVGELLDMARQRVVGFIAMHVDHQSSPGGDFAQFRHRTAAVFHGALEMRNAADHIDAHIQRTDGVRLRGSASVEAVLREGHQLQVDIGRDLLLHLQQRLDGQQPVVADIDMAADGEQPHARRPNRNSEAPAPSPPHAVSSGFNSPQSAMPSSNVPDALMRGRP